MFVIARDNESEILAQRLGEDEEMLLFLGEASVSSLEADAKWQVAEQLGTIANGKGEAELILLQLVNDNDEYVSRRALTALGVMGSRHAEALAVRAWDSGLEYQRIAALWVLKAVKSEKLPGYLLAANADGRQGVVQNAREIQIDQFK